MKKTLKKEKNDFLKKITKKTLKKVFIDVILERRSRDLRLGTTIFLNRNNRSNENVGVIACFSVRHEESFN